jgi:hypothetical protein
MLYTLRLWRDGERPEDWRASLKDLSTKEERRFGSLEALSQFLVALSSHQNESHTN